MARSSTKAITSLAQRIALLEEIMAWAEFGRFGIDLDLLRRALVEARAQLGEDQESAARHAYEAMMGTLEPVRRLVDEYLYSMMETAEQLVWRYPSELASRVWEEMQEADPANPSLPKVRGAQLLVAVYALCQFLARKRWDEYLSRCMVAQ